MIFTLVYDGDLPPNGNADDKWRIRREIEPQLRKLWTTPPLDTIAKYADPNYLPNDSYAGRTFEGLEYVPLICEALSLRAELDVFVLSASQKGGLLHGGDIDNRLKTLLDALAMPANGQQLPQSRPCESDKRVFCLLENDRLVVNLKVSNDRLLTEPDFGRRALVVVRVRPIAFEVRMSNLAIAV